MLKIIKSLTKKTAFVTTTSGAFLSHQYINKQLKSPLNFTPSKKNPPIQSSSMTAAADEKMAGLDSRDREILKDLIKNQHDLDILLKSLDRPTLMSLSWAGLVTQPTLNLYIKVNQPKVL